METLSSGALGLMEVIGHTAAMAAADAAVKAGQVRVLGVDTVIGAGKAVSLTVRVTGEVAAVQAAVQAGELAAQKVGTVLSVHVIPRPHSELGKLWPGQGASQGVE